MSKKKFTPVVAMLNMKGGVGKTTLSANLFRRLYLNRQVSSLLIDMDPQFNLSQSLFRKAEYEALKKSRRTVSAIMEQGTTKAGLKVISSSHQSPPSSSEVIKLLKYIEDTDPRITLDIVPGDFDLVKFSLMEDSAKLKLAKERFQKFIDQVKDEYGLVVLDCNPSSSFLTLCSLAACTHIVVPVRLDKYSVIGLEMLWEFVHNRLTLMPKPQFVVVINGAKRSKPTKAMVETENELRGHNVFGSRTLANTMRETAQLKARSDYTGFSLDRKTTISDTVRKEMDKLADELADKLGL